jgi:hypothetical protein
MPGGSTGASGVLVASELNPSEAKRLVTIVFAGVTAGVVTGEVVTDGAVITVAEIGGADGFTVVTVDGTAVGSVVSPGIVPLWAGEPTLDPGAGASIDPGGLLSLIALECFDGPAVAPGVSVVAVALDAWVLPVLVEIEAVLEVPVLVLVPFDVLPVLAGFESVELIDPVGSGEDREEPEEPDELLAMVLWVAPLVPPLVDGLPPAV